MQRICLYCKNYHHEKAVYDGMTEGQCELYPERCKEWWKRNGNLPLKKAEEMECFDESEHQKKFNRMIEGIDKLLDEISDKLK